MNKIERILIGTIGKKLGLGEEFQKILANTGWLLLDRIFRLGIGLLVSVKITRYLGPEQYGLMNYAIAFAVLFQPLTNLGLDSILVRDLIKYPDRKNEYLGSAFALKLAGSIMAILSGLLAIYLADGNKPLVMLIVFLQLSTFMFLCLDVIDIYYQTIVKSKYSVYAKNIAFFISTAVKIYLLFIKADLLAFVLAQLSETILMVAVQYTIYVSHGNNPLKWRIQKDIMKTLLSEGYLMMLSGLLVVIYMRIDQVMLGKLSGESEVGIFSAAVRVSEVWYFIPIAIVNSVMPNVVKASTIDREMYLSKLQKLFDILFWLSVCVAIATTFLSDWVITTLYKEAFVKSSGILTIHIWGGIFVCYGVASTQYLVNEGLSKIIFYRTFAGAVTNVVFNSFLIPMYSYYGAAISTTISLAVAGWVFTLFFKESRLIFFMFFKSFNLPRVIKSFST